MKEEKVLKNRQKEVLKLIIVSHINSATPIGSAFISEMLELSSATIRNAMGELEEMGYLGKPHTSAGRIPTSIGYRYYVNNLLELDSIPAKQKRYIERESYSETIDSIEAILERVSHILSILTRYTGIACTSSLKFYIEGASNMIDMPEFSTPRRIRTLLKLFDEKAELVRLFNEDLNTDGVKIHIGNEDSSDILNDLSFITANYRVQDDKKGSLGVLGPMRMNYSTLIPLVNYLSKTIEAVLDEMEIESD
ncbi:MAG: hypothetical protein ISS26_05895 [Candidatus Omnitrophica bacterium]|nr:hypothetical protein [Candidatus Omnitrophota bacterium]